VTSPPADPRLFVVEQAGLVKVVSGGVTKTFLDVGAITNTNGNERGLLSIAFPPDYATSGLSYVFLTGTDGSLQIYEHRRSADPDVADPASRRLVISIPHPDASNHNGGQLSFGPDGLLYASTGDGGGANDTGQDAERTNSLLGKILRFDPRGTAPGAHSVPADNPFGNEIWAYGLRNPWRFSFDRSTGDLVIADVGQGHREEIDVARAGAGRGRGVNYGWRCFEGKIPTPASTDSSAPETPALCDAGDRPANATPPVIDFTHEGDGFCSITGGFVVRDPGLPSLEGRYLYADFCEGQLRSLDLGDPGTDGHVGIRVGSPSSFGEDACGRVYAVSRSGVVNRLQEGAATPCSFPPPAGSQGPVPPGGPGASGAGADTLGPRLEVRVTGRRSLAARRRLRVSIRSDEPAALRITGRLRGVARFRTARRELAAGRRVVLNVRITKRSARTLRRTLRRKRVIAALSIVARDAAGNPSQAARRLKVPRRG
jgi:hypothetical protein